MPGRSLSLSLSFCNVSDWSPDPRLLMAEDKRWRSDTGGSGSSVEPSMSSFTNGTHSSLNSEMEEEELACSVEPGVQYNPYRHFNGHLNSKCTQWCKNIMYNGVNKKRRK